MHWNYSALHQCCFLRHSVDVEFVGCRFSRLGVRYVLDAQKLSSVKLARAVFPRRGSHEETTVAGSLWMYEQSQDTVVCNTHLAYMAVSLHILICIPYSSPPLDNIRVMVIVWRLRGTIIRTVLCWIVWHNVHSQQHTCMSSSYRSNRLGLSHWDPYAVCKGGCSEMYYCNMVEWFWWDSSLISTTNWFSFSALTVLVWSSGL